MVKRVPGNTKNSQIDEETAFLATATICIIVYMTKVCHEYVVQEYSGLILFTAEVHFVQQ
jgi:hypothetical protein